MEAGFDALGNVVGRYGAADPRGAGRDDRIAPGQRAQRRQVRRPVRHPHRDRLRARSARRAASGCRTRSRSSRSATRKACASASTLIGSKAMAGSFDPAWLDAGRRPTASTLRAGADRRSAAIPTAGATLDRRGRNVVAYVESHIEQGPVLLNEGLPVGVVTAIAGATRAARARHRARGPRGHRADGRAARRADRGAPRWCSSSSALRRAQRGARRHRRQDDGAAAARST